MVFVCCVNVFQTPSIDPAEVTSSGNTSDAGPAPVAITTLDTMVEESTERAIQGRPISTTMAPETTAYRDDGSVDVPFPGHDDAFSDNCGASVKGIVLRGCAAARDLPAATGRTAKEGALRLASACRSLRSKASAAGSAAGAGLGPAGLAVAAKAMKARGALGQVRQGLSKKHVRYRALAALAIAATTLSYFYLIYHICSIYPPPPPRPRAARASQAPSSQPPSCHFQTPRASPPSCHPQVPRSSILQAATR